MTEHMAKQTLPVAVQPDPMLEDRAGPFRTFIAMLAGVFVIVLVLYGLSRPPEPPVPAAPPQGGPAQAAATVESGQQPNTAGAASAEQSKTGQGQAAGAARSDSSTTGKATAAPSDKPEQKK